MIEGNIVAGTVICVGGVTGDIVASEKVLLIAPAVFKGRVKTPCLSLQEGVAFLGTSEVQNPGLTVSDENFEGESTESMTMAHGVAWSGELQLQGKRLISTAESGTA